MSENSFQYFSGWRCVEGGAQRGTPCIEPWREKKMATNATVPSALATTIFLKWTNSLYWYGGF
eukprot:1332210-Amorphochlora_amoeboformis.AAC.2